MLYTYKVSNGGQAMNRDYESLFDDFDTILDASIDLLVDNLHETISDGRYEDAKQIASMIKEIDRA